MNACAICRTTRREVQWSHRLGQQVCLQCYLADAPKGKRTPYRRPRPAPPTPRDSAEQRLLAAMGRVAPVGYIKGGLAGTCPLCRMTLWAYIGSEQTELQCSSGCGEDAVWQELAL